MTLVDFEIIERCKRNRLIEPFDPEMVNPASIDVRIGDSVLVERKITFDARYTQHKQFKEGWAEIDISDRTADNPYWIQPCEFILVATLETFNMPSDLVGEFRLKSSRAREGYDNALAVWLDPEWSGSKLTLEIVNNRRLTSIPLYPGLKIGQAIFHKCNAPDRTYQVTGRYNNDVKVSASKG